MMARIAGHLGRYAEVRRRACGLRQIDLARRLGVGRQWVIALEHGRRGLDLDLVLRAYEELGLELTMGCPRDQRPGWVEDLLIEREQTKRRPSCRPRIRRRPELLDQLRERADRHERPRPTAMAAKQAGRRSPSERSAHALPAPSAALRSAHD